MKSYHFIPIPNGASQPHGGFRGNGGNDFHDRKDLTPNVCALYVEPELRCRGIAGQLLAHICKDMAAKGIGPHRNFFTPLR